MRSGTGKMAAALAVVLPLLVSPALSMGDGGGGGGGGGGSGGSGGSSSGGSSSGSDGSNQTATKCYNGKVWDNREHKCVAPGHTDLETIYEGGRALAMAGRYGDAIEVLSTIADSEDPRVLNYLGYSHRKQGRVLVGLGYYQEALIADPNYTLAREYMGEAYLQINDVASAEVQLDEIATRRGTGCEEYRVLKAQIDDYVSNG